MLLDSYLTDRSCMTQLDKSLSNKSTIDFGVAQGSILGPILFNLYINDIKSIVTNNESINLFADDTCLFCSAKNYTDLNDKCNNTLKICQDWLNSNGLSLNAQKTHFVEFSKIRNHNGIISLKINNETLNERDETKYLGVIIQNNLKWDSHIKEVIKKINQKIPLFYQLRNSLPATKRIIIFNSLIMSNIVYGIELYAKNKNNFLNILQKAQNRLLKVLFKFHRLKSTNSIHRENEVLKISDQYKLRSLLIGHKVIHHPDKTNITHKNIKRIDHNRILRNNLNLEITTFSFRNNSKISEKSSAIWNEIPNNIKIIKNRDLFKSRIRKSIIDTYI